MSLRAPCWKAGLVGAIGVGALLAQAGEMPAAKPELGQADAAPALANGEQAGAATILHRDEVLKGRGTSGRHLWSLISTPEARMNYFEVTGRSSLHFHPDADHRIYVLEGTVVVTCGSTTATCGPGDFIIIPRGVRHCYDVPTPGARALLLTFDAPPYDPRKTVNVEGKAALPKTDEKEAAPALKSAPNP